MTNILPRKQALTATLIKWLTWVSARGERRNRISDVLSTLDNHRLKDIGLERKQEGHLAIHPLDADKGQKAGYRLRAVSGRVICNPPMSTGKNPKAAEPRVGEASSQS